MVLMMFSIYDVKTNHYRPPICCQNQPDAIRFFTSLMKREQGRVFTEFPEDFRIYTIGDFDDEKGKLLQHSAKGILCEVKDLIPSKGDPKNEQR